MFAAVDVARVAAGLDGGVLGRQPERVVAHRVQHEVRRCGARSARRRRPSCSSRRGPCAGRPTGTAASRARSCAGARRAPDRPGSASRTRARRPTPPASGSRSPRGRSARCVTSFVSGNEKASRVGEAQASPHRPGGRVGARCQVVRARSRRPQSTAGAPGATRRYGPATGARARAPAPAPTRRPTAVARTTAADHLDAVVLDVLARQQLPRQPAGAGRHDLDVRLPVAARQPHAGRSASASSRGSARSGAARAARRACPGRPASTATTAAGRRSAGARARGRSARPRPPSRRCARPNRASRSPSDLQQRHHVAPE